MTDELKPCPHCGKEVELVGPEGVPGGEVWVHCKSCRQLHSTREKAIAAWNARAPAVPEGYALVPVVPTLDMTRAGVDFLPCTPGGCTRETAASVFDAMLAAARKVPG